MPPWRCPRARHIGHSNGFTMVTCFVSQAWQVTRCHSHCTLTEPGDAGPCHRRTPGKTGRAESTRAHRMPTRPHTSEILAPAPSPSPRLFAATVQRFSAGGAEPPPCPFLYSGKKLAVSLPNGLRPYRPPSVRLAIIALESIMVNPWCEAPNSGGDPLNSPAADSLVIVGAARVPYTAAVVIFIT